jgi:mandelate racemase
LILAPTARTDIALRVEHSAGFIKSSAPIAAAAGIQISTHLYPEVASHLMRITETAHWLEWQDWANPILKRPFPVKGSCLEIPNLPGVGIEWDEAAVNRYRI